MFGLPSALRRCARLAGNCVQCVPICLNGSSQDPRQCLSLWRCTCACLCAQQPTRSVFTVKYCQPRSNLGGLSEIRSFPCLPEAPASTSTASPEVVGCIPWIAFVGSGRCSLELPPIYAARLVILCHNLAESSVHTCYGASLFWGPTISIIPERHSTANGSLIFIEKEKS